MASRLVKGRTRFRFSPQDRRNTIAIGAVFASERIEYCYNRRRSDLIAPRKRTLRIIRAELHCGIDILSDGNSFLPGECSFIDDHRKCARKDTRHRIIDLLAALPQLRKKIDN